MSESNIQLIKKLLDYSSTKQKVISKNIANVATKGYVRKDIEFEEILNNNLNSSIKKTNSKHISMTAIEKPIESNFKIIDDNDSESNSSLNNVNIDKEMAEMAENSIMFKFAARKLNGYYRTMQNVIKGGR